MLSNEHFWFHSLFSLRSYLPASVNQLFDRNQFIWPIWSPDWKMVSRTFGISDYWNLLVTCKIFPFSILFKYWSKIGGFLDSNCDIDLRFDFAKCWIGICHWNGWLLYDAGIGLPSWHSTFSGVWKRLCVGRCSILSWIRRWTSFKVSILFTHVKLIYQSLNGFDFSHLQVKFQMFV
jgi:hypothetical protein